jgi:hypothetical protein
VVRDARPGQCIRRPNSRIPIRPSKVGGTGPDAPPRAIAGRGGESERSNSHFARTTTVEPLMQLIALLARWCYALTRVLLGLECTMGMPRITIVSATLSLTAAMSVLPVQVARAQPPSTTVIIPSNNATVSGTS